MGIKEIYIVCLGTDVQHINNILDNGVDYAGTTKEGNCK